MPEPGPGGRYGVIGGFEDEADNGSGEGASKSLSIEAAAMISPDVGASNPGIW